MPLNPSPRRRSDTSSQGAAFGRHPPNIPELRNSMQSNSRYSSTAIGLHWLMALLILANFGLGLYMADLEFSLARVKLFNYHKWTGVTILALAALRLLWRLTHRPPAPLAGPKWQHTAADVTHWILYALFFAVPLTGWAYSSAAGFPIVWFGVLPLPDFVAKNKELSELIKPWHGYIAWVLATVVALHVAAVAKHLLIDKDGTLRRMLPGRA
jgi:cytochrome b561